MIILKQILDPVQTDISAHREVSLVSHDTRKEESEEFVLQIKRIALLENELEYPIQGKELLVRREHLDRVHNIRLEKLNQNLKREFWTKGEQSV